METLTNSDKALKIIRDAIEAAGLTSTSVIIMSADHGAHNVNVPATGDLPARTVATHGQATSDDVEIPWVAWGLGVKKDYNITAPVIQYDTAATALWLLGVPLPESFWGRPVTSAFQ
jgi:arylsulfatase A-like enzyme